VHSPPKQHHPTWAGRCGYADMAAHAAAHATFAMRSGSGRRARRAPAFRSPHPATPFCATPRRPVTPWRLRVEVCPVAWGRHSH